MEKLVIVRHGEYEYRDGDNHLNREGRKKVIEVASCISEMLSENEGIVIFSSPSTRAVETAEIFADTLGLDISSINQELAIGADSWTEKMIVWLTDASKKHKVIIAVTHLEHTKFSLPEFIRQEFIEEFKRFELWYARQTFDGTLKAGEAVLIDFVSKDFSMVR
ncbi:MAG: histidine phosphatase family protein [bacterium]